MCSQERPAQLAFAIWIKEGHRTSNCLEVDDAAQPQLLGHVRAIACGLVKCPAHHVDGPIRKPLPQLSDAKWLGSEAQHDSPKMHGKLSSVQQSPTQPLVQLKPLGACANSR